MTRPSDARFLTTRWSVVLAARAPDEPLRRAALEELCGAYWYPLYAYLRRSGARADEAADLVQGFFARVLERGDFAGVDPARGRFRSWLLAAARHFAVNERERAAALKRGGGAPAVALDAPGAEARLAREPVDPGTPERAFERAWAEEVIARALARLAGEERRIGRGTRFEALRPSLVADGDAPPHAAVAASLGSSENAVKVALHRLRRRFGELVREEVAGTLAAPEEVEDELRALFAALAGGSGPELR